jgi:hypothetical protein
MSGVGDSAPLNSTDLHNTTLTLDIELDFDSLSIPVIASSVSGSICGIVILAAVVWWRLSPQQKR